jgi:hypothetical protein
VSLQRLPGEGRDPFLPWASAFAGVTVFWWQHWSTVDTEPSEWVQTLETAPSGFLGENYSFLRRQKSDVGRCRQCRSLLFTAENSQDQPPVLPLISPLVSPESKDFRAGGGVSWLFFHCI